MGLRLGSTLCRPHTCQHCGADVNHLATHGLSCKKSKGRHHRHAAINDILRTSDVAAAAEERKVAKYMALGRSHSFTPVAIETQLGAIGPKSLTFIRDLGYRMKQRTDEDRTLTYLLQRLSVAIQRGNPASAMGSIGN